MKLKTSQNLLIGLPLEPSVKSRIKQAVVHVGLSPLFLPLNISMPCKRKKLRDFLSNNSLTVVETKETKDVMEVG